MIQLTYPWALLSLLSIPLIIALYSLRPKRRKLRLSTTILWREALREQQRGLGLQKLLRDLSLILLLLIALLLSVAVSGPQWLTRTSENHDTILILDTSASMQAGARFSDAKRQAEDLIADLPDGARMAIMSSARHALLRSAFENNKQVLQEVLAGLEAGDEAGRPRAALTLALSLLRNRQQGKIYFLSDAAFTDNIDFTSSLIDYRIVADSEPSRNIAITQFDFRPEIGTEERFQMLLSVRNYIADEVTVPVTVTLNQNILLKQELRLAANTDETLVLSFQGRAQGRAQASIDIDDDLAADNQAFAVMATDQNISVLLLSQGNFYLQSILTALPNVQLSSLDNISSNTFAQQAANYDLLVLDQMAVTTLPAGNYLLINTIPPGLPFASTGSVQQPVIQGQSTSALMQQVDLSGVNIEAAQQLDINQQAVGLQRLFWSQETDLALALLQDKLRLVYLGFALQQSNFPLQTAFPLFIRQSLAWLHQRDNRFAATQLLAGATFAIELPVTASTVTVNTPSGKTLNYQAENGQLLFNNTSEAGIYRYQVADLERHFAINLTDEHESNLTPRARLPQPPAAANKPTATAQISLALWPYLIILALLLLSLEWGLWCARRGHA